MSGGGTCTVLKRLCHEINGFSRLMIINKYILYIQYAERFYNFLFLVDEKIKLKGLACSFEITY